MAMSLERARKALEAGDVIVVTNPDPLKAGDRATFCLKQGGGNIGARQVARTALHEQVMMLDEGCIARSSEVRTFLAQRRVACS